MTWLQNIAERFAAVCGMPRRVEPSPLDLARARRWEAAQDYAKAKEIGDTRRQNYAHRRFRRATTEVLRLEREACR